MSGRRFRIIHQGRKLQRVAARVVLEGALVPRVVLERLAQGELQMYAFRIAHAGRCQLLLHRGEIRRGEPEGLQVRQAPVGAAQSGAHLERAPIGLDGLRLLADFPQQVSVQQPQAFLAGLLGNGLPQQREAFIHAPEQPSVCALSARYSALAGSWTSSRSSSGSTSALRC